MGVYALNTMHSPTRGKDVYSLEGKSGVHLHRAMNGKWCRSGVHLHLYQAVDNTWCIDNTAAMLEGKNSGDIRSSTTSPSPLGLTWMAWAAAFRHQRADWHLDPLLTVMEMSAAELAAEAETKRLLAAEAAQVAKQERGGVSPLCRIVGDPSSWGAIDIDTKTVTFRNFATVAAPSMASSGGSVYYEVRIVEALKECQFGFTSADAREPFPFSNAYSTNGTGDVPGSWGFDGDRHLMFDNGKSQSKCAECDWGVGDVISFFYPTEGAIKCVKHPAAAGGVAVEVQLDCGDCDGVFPSFTASRGVVEYALEPPFQFPFPPVSHGVDAATSSGQSERTPTGTETAMGIDPAASGEQHFTAQKKTIVCPWNATMSNRVL